MIPVRDDISLVEGFILTIQKTIQENGDPDDTNHLHAESYVEDFLAAMKWVKQLHGHALLLSDEARDQEWKQFLNSINDLVTHVVRWAYENYPEGLIQAKMYRQRGGSVWDPSGITDEEIFEEDEEDSRVQQDWTWSLKAAMELKHVTKVLFQHCKQVAGMIRMDYMTTELDEMSL